MAGISYRNRNKNLRTVDGRPRKPSWEYRFYGATIRGKKQVIQKSGFATKQEAVIAGNKAYTEYMQAGSIFTHSEMSYSDCLDAWLTDYVAIKCKETTRAGYAKSVELYIRPALGKYRLAAIKPENIQQFINDMYYRSFSRNTLTWDDIDLQNGILTVNRQIQWVHDLSRWRFTSPKYESTRVIPLDNVIWALLKREHARQSRDRLRIGHNYLRYFTDKDDLLCQGEGEKEVRLVHVRWDGSYIQSRATQHSNHVIKTELGVTGFDFHSLRHTHATELCEAGVNLKEIQRRLGHKSMEITTRKYIHATDEMQRQSLEIMNRMYQAT